MTVDFRILGPLEVRADGSPLPLGGVKQRALLAVLLLHANESLTSDRLIDELWGERPPPTAANTLHVHLSRLRRALAAADGRSLLVRGDDGYRLELAPEELDRNRFQALVSRARLADADGHYADAADLLREAMALWRGPPLADLRYEPFADAAIAELEELRLATLKDRIDADLALGRHEDVVAELAALVEAHPLDERLRAQLMLAFYRCGRQAEALDSYAAARRSLDELGLEPGEELRRLQVSILQQDSGLSPPADAPTVGADRPRRRRPVLLAALAVVAASVAFAASALRGDDSVVVPPNSVAIVDPATNVLVGWVAVGAEPTRLAAGGRSVWVVNAGDHTLSRLDPSRREVVDSVPLRALAPAAVAANESSVWIVGTVGGASSLVRVDPRFGEVVETLELGELIPEGYGLGSPKTPGAVAWGAGKLWTAGPRGDLYRLRPRTLAVDAELATEGGVRALAVAEDALWAVLGTAVVRIDPVDRTHQRFALGLGAGPVAIAVDGRAAWVVSPVDDVVSRIDVATGTVTGIAVGDLPRDVAVGMGSVWVANSNDGTLSRIDAESRQVVATIDLGVRVEGVTVANGLVWVTGHSALDQPKA